MRVSPIVLAVFVVLILVGGVFSYIMHEAANKLEEDRQAVITTRPEGIEARTAALKEQQDKYDQLMQALGYQSLEQMDRLVGQGSDQYQVQQVIDGLMKERDGLVKEIGLDLVDVDADGKSVELDKVIQAAMPPGTVPQNLQGTLLGNVIEALRQAQVAREQFETLVAQNKEQIDTLDTQIDAKMEEIKTAIVDGDKKIQEAWSARMQARDRLVDSRKEWAGETAELTQKETLSQAVLDKIESQRKGQENVSAPAGGRLLSYEWKTKSGVISLGANQGVKRGYEFDVFEKFPGADTAENRIYTGKVRVVEVQPEVSLVAVIPSEAATDEHPIMAGDFITSPLFSPSAKKTFYLAGWYPPGSAYDRQTLAGIVRNKGGEVHDTLQLTTDYVVVGVVSEETIPNLSDEAKAEIAKAKADFEAAQRYNATILTVDKFIQFMRE